MGANALPSGSNSAPGISFNNRQPRVSNDRTRVKYPGREYNPLFTQMDGQENTPDEKRSARLTILEGVVRGCITKDQARELIELLELS